MRLTPATWRVAALTVALVGAVALASVRLATAQTVPLAGSVIQPVPPSGGAVSGLSARVEVPPGTAEGTIVVVLVPQEIEALPPPPPKYALAGAPFTLSLQTQAGQQVTPTRPIIISLPLPAGRTVYPAVYRLYQEAWHLVPTGVQGVSVVAEVRGGGIYALFSRPIPPDLPAVGVVSGRLWYWPLGAVFTVLALLWLAGGPWRPVLP